MALILTFQFSTDMRPNALSDRLEVKRWFVKLFKSYRTIKKFLNFSRNIPLKDRPRGVEPCPLPAEFRRPRRLTVAGSAVSAWWLATVRHVSSRSSWPGRDPARSMSHCGTREWAQQAKTRARPQCSSLGRPCTTLWPVPRGSWCRWTICSFQPAPTTQMRQKCQN